jgi:CheY-like chemotaxis protein
MTKPDEQTRPETDDKTPSPTVLVVNSSEDTIEMLRLRLERDGYRTTAAHVPDIKRGRVDLPDLIQTHGPCAIIYDLAPPYAENWTFLKLLQSSDALKGIPMVLTTTNKAEVEALSGEEVIELIGKPYDLDEVARAVAVACDSADKKN